MGPVIYTATFSDGEQYVGATRNYAARVKGHRYDARTGRGTNSRLRAKFKAFGLPDFAPCACPLPGVELHEVESAVIQSLDAALNMSEPTPIRSRPRRRVSVYKSLAEASRARGIPYPRIMERLAAGWDENQAIGLTPPPPRPEVKKRTITIDGTTLAINQWAERLQVPPGVIHSRLYQGWTERQAVGADPGPGAEKSARAAARREATAAKREALRVRYKGFEGSRVEAAERFGIPYATLLYRLNSGWPVEEALTLKVNAHLRPPCHTATNPTELPKRVALNQL